VDTFLSSLAESVVLPDAVAMNRQPDASPPAALRVALLEHDEALREQMLVPGLRRYGFEVEPLASTAALKRALMNDTFDFCVLDTVLSYGEGISLPHWLRSQYPQMGVVIVSSQADPYEHLRGLNEGADAYLGKPVPMEILAATLSSIARRLNRRQSAVPPAPAPSPNPKQPHWQLQADGWCLVSPTGSQTTLTVSERRLIALLWERNGTLVTRDELMRTVANGHGLVGEIDPHGLDVLLYRLRRKVQSRTGQNLPLEVVRSAGYILHRHPAPTGMIG